MRIILLSAFALFLLLPENIQAQVTVKTGYISSYRYKDENGKCHVFSPYCPHLKCIREFDQKDKIWLCPCHQSTYDAYGHLIDGPSLHSLKKKEK
mgnify:CR=1 FL=1